MNAQKTRPLNVRGKPHGVVLRQDLTTPPAGWEVGHQQHEREDEARDPGPAQGVSEEQDPEARCGHNEGEWQEPVGFLVRPTPAEQRERSGRDKRESEC